MWQERGTKRGNLLADKMEGCGPGASLLKGSSNFHSRVLLKLASRPVPCLNTLQPSRPLRPSTLQYYFTECPPCVHYLISDHSFLLHRWWSSVFGTPSVCRPVCVVCEVWSAEPFVFNKYLGCLRILSLWIWWFFVSFFLFIFFKYIIHMNVSFQELSK